jgi:hypothetical protein
MPGMMLHPVRLAGPRVGGRGAARPDCDEIARPALARPLHCGVRLDPGEPDVSRHDAVLAAGQGVDASSSQTIPTLVKSLYRHPLGGHPWRGRGIPR